MSLATRTSSGLVSDPRENNQRKEETISSYWSCKRVGRSQTQAAGINLVSISGQPAWQLHQYKAKLRDGEGKTQFWWCHMTLQNPVMPDLWPLFLFLLQLQSLNDAELLREVEAFGDEYLANRLSANVYIWVKPLRKCFINCLIFVMSLNLNVDFATMSSTGISANGGLRGRGWRSIHIRIVLEKSSLDILIHQINYLYFIF